MDGDMNQGGGAPAQTPPQQTGGDKSMGPVIGSIVVLIVLIAGGLYLWSMKMDEKATDEMMDEQAEMMVEEDAATMQLEMQGSSDEMEDIEKDLNETNLEMDSEIQAL